MLKKWATATAASMSEWNEVDGADTLFVINWLKIKKINQHELYVIMATWVQSGKIHKCKNHWRPVSRYTVEDKV